MSSLPAGTGEVVVKKLASGKYTFEVTVPSTGPGLDEMQEASRIAQVIWDELDEKIDSRPRPAIERQDPSLY